MSPSEVVTAEGSGARIDIRLMAITPSGLDLQSLLAASRAAIRGGADAIQLRDKRLSVAELLERAHHLRALTKNEGVSLVINDRLDVALSVDADGLHLGQEDLPARLAREHWPRGRLLGISASSPELARSAEADGADYIGAGPVFATTSKATGRTCLGPEGIARIVSASAIPVLAIGGITAQNAHRLRGLGAGVAVIGGVFGTHRDPEVEARAILEGLSVS